MAFFHKIVLFYLRVLFLHVRVLLHLISAAFYITGNQLLNKINKLCCVWLPPWQEHANPTPEYFIHPFQHYLVPFLIKLQNLSLHYECCQTYKYDKKTLKMNQSDQFRAFLFNKTLLPSHFSKIIWYWLWDCLELYKKKLHPFTFPFNFLILYEKYVPCPFSKSP